MSNLLCRLRGHLVTAGLRRQQLVVQGYNYASWGSGDRKSSYDESITTPVYGVVFKPWEHVSFYANHIEGLAQGPTSPTSTGGLRVTNGNEVYAPARSKQTEAGVKVDMGTYGASLGVYRIEQPSDGYCEIDSATTCNARPMFIVRLRPMRAPSQPPARLVTTPKIS